MPIQQAVAAPAWNPGPQKGESKGLLWVPSGLRSEFRVILDYRMGLCLKTRPNQTRVCYVEPWNLLSWVLFDGSVGEDTR